MSDRLAFIGDVHGQVDLLSQMLSQLKQLDLEQIIFVGDYVNRGDKSAEVLDLLIAARKDSPLTFLRGNHDEALLDALESGDLDQLLRIGGAATINSYLKRAAEADVLQQLQSAIPRDHVLFLRSLEARYEDEEVVASHMLSATAGDPRYRIGGHSPVGETPAISEATSSIDTGCGLPGGRLTALFWPSLTFIQTR